jgi:acyl-CoA hydrolase
MARKPATPPAASSWGWSRPGPGERPLVSPQTVPECRSVSDSATEMPQLVLPQHANVHGSVLGGTVMHWVDLAAAIVANRHSRRPVVTAAFDEMAFLAPIQVGQLALLKARLTLVDRSSMEIRVDVQSEDLLSGEHRTTGTAFVTFVALDPVTGRPTPVPQLTLETEEERAEHAQALERRRHRLERRNARKSG